MAYKYKAILRKNGINEKENYYPVSDNGVQVDLEYLVKVITFNCSLTPGDVLATVESLKTGIIDGLKMGWTVKINGLGIFSMSITSEPSDSPRDLMPHKVQVKQINFRPDKRLLESVKQTKFERNE